MNSKENNPDEQYQVVALRYRPQSFGDLVGQSHIATALSNAIEKNRVGHAYLFTGARGVGKTSSARIFAKCLNCEKGPTMTPCNECDICQAVSSGEDVDVIEIDGASNRGIDEIRQLRSNAAVRPSRAKYKIYIIDEVHMLTTQAFNALLKTLEEPPLHVKFIFCTTDPQKIPITVLSRCQRFDFSPVQSNEIADRLNEIATAEGVTADEQALALLARRANGSMRDSQSLLEQLFSFCGSDISVDEVHQLLGTADMGRIAEIATAMTNKDATSTLNLIHRGIIEGVDAGQMADQLLGYFRDMMAVRVGCGEDTLLSCTAVDMEQLGVLSEELGLETILTVVQLFDTAVVRMQSSLHARTLLEAAAIRVCNLENLESLSDLVSSLATGSKRPSGAKPKPASRPRVQMRQVESPKPASKKNEVSDAGSSNAITQGASAAAGAAVGAAGAAAIGAAAVDSAVERSGEPEEEKPSLTDGNTNGNSEMVEPGEPVSQKSGLTAANVEAIWKDVLSQVGQTNEMMANYAADYESLELPKPTQLVVTLKDKLSSDMCSRVERKQKFESVLQTVAGSNIRIDFLASKKSMESQNVAPKMTRVQQIRKLQDRDFIKKAISLFDAEVTGYREPAPTKKG